MANIDKGTAGLLASLEERSAQIRTLEREMEGKDNTIRSLGNQLSGAKQLQDMTYKQCEEERGKVAKLSAILATMDDSAVKKLEQRFGGVIHVKDQEITRLRDQLARAEGWIDATLGNHPTRGGSAPWRGGTMDRARNGGAMMAMDPGGGGDISVLAWKDRDGQWRARPVDQEDIPF